MEGQSGIQKRILIIDGHRTEIELYSVILRRLKLQIDTAGNHEEACKKIKTLKPDIIAIEVTYPPILSANFIRDIRKVDRIPCPKIIALSPCVMKGDRELLLSSGCDEFISVPIDTRRFYTIFESFIIENDGGYPVIHPSIG